MKPFRNKRLYGALALFLGALVCVLTTWYVHYHEREIEYSLRAELSRLHESLFQLAELTDRNDGDTVVNEIIRPCARFGEYETTLSNLHTLTMKELLTAQVLLDSCGGFYPERKAVMVAKMEQELAHFEQSLATLLLITDNDTEQYTLDLWRELVTLERSRSESLKEQLRIQNEIVTSLIQGDRPQSERIQSLLTEAQGVAELLIVYNKKIDDLRARIAL